MTTDSHTTLIEPPDVVAGCGDRPALATPGRLAARCHSDWLVNGVTRLTLATPGRLAAHCHGLTALAFDSVTPEHRSTHDSEAPECHR